VAFWVHGVAAQRASGSAGVDQVPSSSHQAGRLRPGQAEPARPSIRIWRRVVFPFIILLVDRSDLLGQDDDSVGGAVVGQLYGPDHPLGLERFDERQDLIVRYVIGDRKVRQDFSNEPSHRCHLLFLQLQSDELVALAGLEVERALTWLSDRSHRRPFDLRELE
jgi:hypothetical protein